MEFPYMIVVFLDKLAEGQVVMTQRNPHVTVKKKFKLVALSESELISILSKNLRGSGPVPLILEDTKTFDSTDYRVVEVRNRDAWKQMHDKIVGILGDLVISRDPHYEGSHYYPHMSWMFRGKQMFDPSPYIHTNHQIDTLYLIKRIHPIESRARIIKKIIL